MKTVSLTVSQLSTKPETLLAAKPANFGPSKTNPQLSSNQTVDGPRVDTIWIN